MPISAYQNGELYGLKNSNGRIILDPVYESFEIYKEFICGRLKTNDDNEEIHYIDHSGDILANLNKTLPDTYYGAVIDAYPLNETLRVIIFRDWDSLELSGLTNEFGQLLINAEYDEFDMLPNGLVTAFHGAHYEEYDADYNELYGKKVFNRFFNLLSNSALDDYEDDGCNSKLTLYFQNGDIIVTDWNGNIIR